MPDPHASRIQTARSTEDVEAVVALFRAYASSLDIDLSFQGFDVEMAAMPGRYAQPAGALFLARDAQGKAVGCVGLRSIQPKGSCEMKRLYVLPETRGSGLGGRLIEAVIRRAVRIGYNEMRLDTLPSMLGAMSLYARAGFVPISPYYGTPVAGTVFLGRRLSQ